jgi:hypothetical protein
LIKRYLKIYRLCFLVYVSCDCSPKSELATTPVPAKSYYNLEIIDLGVQGAGDFSFEFNGKNLIKEGDLYVSKELIVYQAHNLTNKDKWYATVIGSGGISSKIKISNQEKLIQEVEISTTNQVIEHQDSKGPEWPGMVNGRNVCFANVVYKLMARCTGFDQVLSEDKPDTINTLLRNLINGIRLGKSSALQDAQVNVKVSDLLLDKVTEKSGQIFNDKGQHDAYLLMVHIHKLLYPEPVHKLKDNQEIDSAIQELQKHKPPFKYIAQARGTSPVYVMVPSMPRLVSIFQMGVDWYLEMKGSEFVKYFSLSRFCMYVPNVGGSKTTQIVETLKIPLWDHKVDRQIKEETYKLIGFACHIGTDSAGHYIAHINFNAHGWYLHNDATVSPRTTQVKETNTLRLMALYERQD